MKLRNKKTGKVQTCDMVVITDEQMDGEIASLNRHTFIFRSVEQFNDDYEAYTPTEPLIKDEKIRKAVRAWAEALKENTIRFDRVSQGFSFGDGNVYSSINFDGFVFDLADGKKYTIADLCGEEEE